MNILLTNDDGFNAPGLTALYKEIRKIAQVYIVAPDKEQSGAGHAITISSPLRVKEIKKNGSLLGYSVNGTPADCVKLGLQTLIKEKIDLVISGINPGPNIGVSVLYSGTVSAAVEAAILGVPAVAISLAVYKNPNFGFAAKFMSYLTRKIIKNKFPSHTLLNVNIPLVKKNKIKGVAVTTQCHSKFVESFEKRYDPRGNIYYWMKGYMENLDKRKDTDVEALNKNKISITPVHFDMTNRSYIKEIKKWGLTIK
jgi:5'-nucleotidase